eukprot:m.39946 g.39946  ORF g.39946 m.39946 type:complete len:623 (+) comp8026_c0_seq1:2-1870(+)
MGSPRRIVPRRLSGLILCLAFGRIGIGHAKGKAANQGESRKPSAPVVGDGPSASVSPSPTVAGAIDGLLAALSGTKVQPETNMHEQESGVGRDMISLEAEIVRLKHLGDVEGAIELLEDALYSAVAQDIRQRVYTHLRRLRRAKDKGRSTGGGAQRMVPLPHLDVSVLQHTNTSWHFATPVVSAPLDTEPRLLFDEIALTCSEAVRSADGQCRPDPQSTVVRRVVESLCATWTSAASSNRCNDVAAVQVARARANAPGDAMGPTVEMPSYDQGVVTGYILVSPENAQDLNARYLRLRDPREAARVRPYPTGLGYGVPQMVELKPGHVVSFPGWVQRSLPPNPEGASPRVYLQVTIRIPCSIFVATPAGSEALWATPITIASPGWLEEALAQQLLTEVKAAEAVVESVHKSNEGGFQTDVDLDSHSPSATRLRLELYHAVGATLARHVGAKVAAPESACSAACESDDCRCEAEVNKDQNEANDLSPHFDARIHEIWAGISRAHQPNHPHVHPKSDLSGVVYLALPEIPGSLTFSDPRGAQVMCGGSGAAFRVTPARGMLVLFPSWLEHWVEPHREGVNDDSDDGRGAARVVVPFNAEVDRKDPDSVGFVLRVPATHLLNAPNS